MKKLHLGCGQRYFDGYVNIDYPLTEHSVQQNTVADEFHNLLEMRYPGGTIDEVRLHHVFEHFTRGQACALLASWNSWLSADGVVHIEVPDFGRTAKAVLGTFSSNRAKYVGLRHIFGSQEAHWAVHYEGYTKNSLGEMLGRFGFKISSIKQERYKDTYNLIVIAKKAKALSTAEAEIAATDHLRQYMVDDSASEQVLLAVWLAEFSAQLAKTRAAV